MPHVDVGHTMSVMTGSQPTSAMDRLTERLSRLPGLGKRSAQRVAFYLLKRPAQEANELAEAIVGLKRDVRHCSICFNLSESDPCPICDDPRRDQGLVLVVEQPNDVATIEATGLYRGVYHVLMGCVSPLDGVSPNELNITSLLERAEHDNRGHRVREVVLGTNPTLEGDGTALYLLEKLSGMGVDVTRLARGLPTGSNLETVSKAVLCDAIEGRHPLGSL